MFILGQLAEKPGELYPAINYLNVISMKRFIRCIATATCLLLFVSLNAQPAADSLVIRGILAEEIRSCNNGYAHTY